MKLPRLSRTKVSAAALFLVHALQQAGILDLSQEALTSLTTILASAVAWFLRSALDRLPQNPDVPEEPPDDRRPYDPPAILSRNQVSSLFGPGGYFDRRPVKRRAALGGVLAVALFSVGCAGLGDFLGVQVRSAAWQGLQAIVLDDIVCRTELVCEVEIAEILEDGADKAARLRTVQMTPRQTVGLEADEAVELKLWDETTLVRSVRKRSMPRSWHGIHSKVIRARGSTSRSVEKSAEKRLDSVQAAASSAPRILIRERED